LAQASINTATNLHKALFLKAINNAFTYILVIGTVLALYKWITKVRRRLYKY